MTKKRDIFLNRLSFQVFHRVTLVSASVVAGDPHLWLIRFISFSPQFSSPLHRDEKPQIAYDHFGSSYPVVLTQILMRDFFFISFN